MAITMKASLQISKNKIMETQEKPKCQTCKGSGKVIRITHTILGNKQTKAICPTCKGNGFTNK